MKLTKATFTEVEVDLMAMPTEDWPKEAKSVAFGILARRKMREEMLRQLPAMRKGWLITQVEYSIKVTQEFEKEWQLKLM
jgi:hypothetical protein